MDKRWVESFERLPVQRVAYPVHYAAYTLFRVGKGNPISNPLHLVARLDSWPLLERQNGGMLTIDANHFTECGLIALSGGYSNDTSDWATMKTSF